MMLESSKEKTTIIQHINTVRFRYIGRGDTQVRCSHIQKKPKTNIRVKTVN